MTEWQVVGVVVVLVGLVGTIIGPMLRLNTSITKLTVTLENANRDISETREDLSNFERTNAQSHQRLWDHNNRQDAALTDHEKRIHRMEGEKGSKL